MTAEELYALPDDGMLNEIVEGWLVSEPPPGFEHGGIEEKISRLFGHFVSLTSRRGIALVRSDAR